MSGKAYLVVALVCLSVYTTQGMPQRGNDIGTLVKNKIAAKANLINASVALGKGIVQPIVDIKAGIIKPIIGIKASIARPIFQLKRQLIIAKKNLAVSVLRPAFRIKASKLSLVRDLLDKKINLLRGF